MGQKYSPCWQKVKVKKKVLDMLWIWIVPHRFLCWESICLGCFHWELIGLGGRQPCQWTHLMNSDEVGGRSSEGTWSIEPRSVPISCSQILWPPLFPWCSLFHNMLLLPCRSDAPLVTVKKPSKQGLKLWNHEPRQSLSLADLFLSSILSQWGRADWHISRGHPSKWQVVNLQFYERSVLME